MANLTVDHIKTIVQSIIAGVTRYKPNLTVTDPDDPRYVVGAERMSKRVDAAQSTADAAQSTADAAQSTADAAQSTADAAQSTADAAIGFENISYTLQFDQDTTGRDTFVYNAWHYYKVSDFTCPLFALVSMTGTNLAGETVTGYIDANESCVRSMLWFIVNNAGKISVDGKSFTAPSTGLYALYSEPKTGWASRERYCADTVTISYKTAKIKLHKYSLGVSESGVMMVKDADGNVIPQPDTEAREMAETAQSTAQTAQSAADAIKAAGTDWDQNDSTALNYIKNRTHYSVPTQTIKCDTAVVTEQISQSVAGSSSSSAEMYALKTDAPLPTAEDIIGARVTIDNVTYTITSEDILKNSSTVYACKYLPNKDWTQAAGVVSFFVNVEKYMTMSAAFPSGLNNAHTVVTLPGRGVYFQTYGTTIEYGGGVVPLDEKYLPASVTSITLKSATSGSTKRFRLTVDDTGAIKTEEVTT